MNAFTPPTWVDVFTPPTWKEFKGTIDRYKGRMNWVMCFWMAQAHITGIWGLFWIPRCKKETLLFSCLLALLGGLGITVGAHRLWSHRSFEASFPVRFILMICNSIALQGTIDHWVRNHRIHHKFSETDADPYNARNGFFFSHVGWLLVHPHPEFVKAAEEIDCSDIWEDPVVRWQHIPVLKFACSHMLPVYIAHKCWGEKIIPAYMVAVCFRYMYVLNVTFLVNSAAHIFGDHPYDVTSYPAENPTVSWFAFGEGWHNWHHKYPYDYAASEFGIFRQFNPSKLCIDILAALGLVWGRKRATAAWSRGRELRDNNAKKGIPLPKRELRPWDGVDTVKID